VKGGEKPRKHRSSQAPRQSKTGIRKKDELGENIRIKKEHMKRIAKEIQSKTKNDVKKIILDWGNGCGHSKT